MTTQQVAPRAQRKVRLGVVTSNKMSKTIVVRVTRSIRHPKYGRVMTQASSFKVHDETNSAAIGDLVNIMETRPLSKEKRWRLVKIVRRASTAPPVPGAEDVSVQIPKVATAPQQVVG
jgi:small subunit ribosomal protein S17